MCGEKLLLFHIPGTHKHCLKRERGREGESVYACHTKNSSLHSNIQCFILCISTTGNDHQATISLYDIITSLTVLETSTILKFYVMNFYYTEILLLLHPISLDARLWNYLLILLILGPQLKTKRALTSLKIFLQWVDSVNLFPTTYEQGTLMKGFRILNTPYPFFVLYVKQNVFMILIYVDSFTQLIKYRCIIVMRIEAFYFQRRTDDTNQCEQEHYSMYFL